MTIRADIIRNSRRDARYRAPDIEGLIVSICKAENADNNRIIRELGGRPKRKKKSH
jgi:hypothetical protein